MIISIKRFMVIASCAIIMAISLSLINTNASYAVGNIDEGTTGTCKWEYYRIGNGPYTLQISAKNPSVGGVMDNYTHSSPAPWNKYREKIEEVKFENVLSIGDYSFYNYPNITSVNLKGVTEKIYSETYELIGENVIKGVSRVGTGAFAWCKNIGYIIIFGENCVICEDAFAFCEDVVMNSVDLYGIKSIRRDAFEEVDCRELYLQEGLESIGWGAFNNNEALTTVTIPSTCISISDNAFSACKMLETAYIMNPSCTLEEYAFDKDYYTTLHVYPGSTGEVYAKQYGFNYEFIKLYNPMTVVPKTGTVRYSSLRKKTQYLSRKKVLTINNYEGTLKFKKLSGNKKITINSSTGKVTVRKGLKKKKYKIKVKVTASGNASFEKASEIVTFTVRVK
ncbi:MAG: leucine-rich repeat domain-containing protein [Eubacterium sp.]|nr:leucine-rich repeat domain-containing protein [Eubacterium sp.]